MGNAAVDWGSVPVKFPQFDPDQPDSPPDARLNALYDGESEIAAEEFVEWFIGQDDDIYQFIVDHLNDPEIKAAARRWAKEAA
ncbi:hypothetical protein [Modicisalibacter coralii]|uniref:hypothetical protein n=1 Tax=Modicisalibacter coralii TaxID=2304602 RepID=UPI00100ABB65|nr:hypothetical protein [Halomonas coralii]